MATRNLLLMLAISAKRHYQEQKSSQMLETLPF
jgi:hypothetical protein